MSEKLAFDQTFAECGVVFWKVAPRLARQTVNLACGDILANRSRQ